MWKRKRDVKIQRGVFRSQQLSHQLRLNEERLVGECLALVVDKNLALLDWLCVLTVVLVRRVALHRGSVGRLLDVRLAVALVRDLVLTL